MDVIQNFQDHATEFPSDEDVKINQKLDAGLAQITETDSSQGCFECNICFDSARDPVVTLCGHLYCWACIFQWLRVQTSSSEPVQQQACPLCKANISQASLIPLYCNGPSQTDSELTKLHDDFIPPRPSTSRLQTLMAAATPHSSQLSINPFHSPSPAFAHPEHLPDPYGNYATISSASSLVSTTMAGIINPTIGLLGELVLARMFGSTGSSMFAFPVPNSYAIIEHNNPRIRRQEMELDKSLNRVSIFMFCCLVLCLLLF